jgi:lactobin A/cerein 7B family class IIb bacteriocin
MNLELKDSLYCISELSEDEQQQVSAGIAPAIIYGAVAAGVALIGLIGASYSSGYNTGKDAAVRDNTPAN